MAKNDIENFDYASVVNQITGGTQQKKPNFLKRYAPQIVSTLIGVADNYQTFKLRDKMDDAEFEKTLEIAQLKAKANKFSKRAKETAPNYEKLIANGYKFDKEFKDSETNLVAARKVFGSTAWDNMKTQWDHAFPKTSASLTTYDDYKTQRANWGIGDEEHKKIERYYDAYVKEQAEYVKSGQAIDFNEFNNNLNSLEEMGVKFDPDNYGLMSKIGGHLARKLKYGEETQDMFTSRYLNGPLTEATKAMEVWKESKTPEEYLTAIKDVDVGLWGSLGEERASLLVQLDGPVKERLMDSIQKVYRSNKNLGAVEFRATVDDLLYSGQEPTKARSRLLAIEAKTLLTLEEDTSLTSEQKIKEEQRIITLYKNLSSDYGDLTEPKLGEVLKVKKIINSIEEKVKPLLISKDKGDISPEEEISLKDLEDNLVLLNTNLLAVGSGSSATTILLAQAQESLIVNNRRSLISSALANFSTPNNLGETNKSEPSVPFLKTNVSTLASQSGITDSLSLAQLNDTASSFNSVPTSAQQASAISKFTNNAQSALGEAKQNPAYRRKFFPNKSIKEIEKLEKTFALNPLNDPKGLALTQNQQGIVSFQFIVDRTLLINEENTNNNLNGYFHGMTNMLETNNRDMSMSILINNFLETDKDGNYFIKPVTPKLVIYNMNQYMQNQRVQSPARSGTFDINTSTEVLERAKIEAESLGLPTVALLEKELNRRRTLKETEEKETKINQQKEEEEKTKQAAIDLQLYNSIPRRFLSEKFSTFKKMSNTETRKKETDKRIREMRDAFNKNKRG